MPYLNNKQSSLNSAVLLGSLMNLNGINSNRIRAEVEPHIGDLELEKIDGKDLYLEITGKIGTDEPTRDRVLKQTEERVNASDFCQNHIIPYYESRYPFRLRDIPNAPLVLYAIGNYFNSSLPRSAGMIAVVGTREPTDFGREYAFRAGELAAEHGVAVVSGLAHGCDTQGHKGTLSKNGITIAVMAGGLDKIYPPDNKYLANRILENNGCLISEYPVQTWARSWYFNLRNRIQTGLSDRVLIVETPLKGGTISTADYAYRQKRTLAALQHTSEYSIVSQSQGNKQLIQSEHAIGIEPDDDSLVGFITGRDVPQLPTQMAWKFPGLT